MAGLARARSRAGQAEDARTVRRAEFVAICSLFVVLLWGACLIPLPAGARQPQPLPASYPVLCNLCLSCTYRTGMLLQHTLLPNVTCPATRLGMSTAQASLRPQHTTRQHALLGSLQSSAATQHRTSWLAWQYHEKALSAALTRPGVCSTGWGVHHATKQSADWGPVKVNDKPSTWGAGDDHEHGANDSLLYHSLLGRFMGNTVRMRPRDAAGNGRGVDINAQHRVPPGGGSERARRALPNLS